jgi:hypothetical protein
MVNSFKDAFERAGRKVLEESLDKAGEEQPTSKQIPQPAVASPAATESFADLLSPRQNRLQHEDARQRVKATYGSFLPPTNRRLEKQKAAGLASVAAKPGPPPVPRAPRTVRTRPAAPPVLPPAVNVSVSKHAVCAISLKDSKASPLLSNFETAGRATQIHVGKPEDEREVVLGLDFGTSCVKVVVGDSALGKAFAVPFCKAEGLSKYLLPSRLCQTGRVFSLEAGTHTYRDLKLSLLASPSDAILQQRVVAFLALIIRRARGWLLTEQASTYKRTAIAWKLAVGLPTAQHHQSSLSELFERLSLAAWAVSVAPAEVTETAIQIFLDTDTLINETASGVEITVVPEIAAQIYGFVASNSFDKKAPNIYLMADVGSGTVDSSLFHVKQAKGGRWDFEFYTSVVEPNGVSNLHRHRVNWWTDVLTKTGAQQALIDDLAASKLITDQQLSTPETFLDYFNGVDTKFRDPTKTPDAEFFSLRVLAQVQGKTLWRTWKDGLLPQSSLANIPFFMCGGGVRMGYYQELEPRLSSMPSYSWLKAECWVMGVPDDLVADGVAEDEYDRLSVAYGLSRLEVGKIVKALPQPKIAIPPVNIWRHNYIDKDQC